MTANERRMEKKRQLKEMFDSQYDMKGDSEFYDTWKAELEEQAKVKLRAVVIFLLDHFNAMSLAGVLLAMHSEKELEKFKKGKKMFSCIPDKDCLCFYILISLRLSYIYI